MTNPVTTRHQVEASHGRRRVLLLTSVLAFAACHDSNSSTPPADIPTTPDPVVGENDPLPGVVVDITGLTGGSGAGGNFEVGDFITVTFTLKRNDGVPLELSGLGRSGIMVSGPTSNYQRVIASLSNVISTATKTAVDTYSYTFTSPIPATYIAPLNDTTNLTIGEMTGQPLLSGTYTVGIELRKDYNIDGTVYRDVGNASKDFLLGDATTLEPREVVTLANCNECHTKLSAHGGNRNKLTNCLLCHTAGSEDGNVASVGGGTPGVTVDFKVMIHKIHAGAFLPSVLGVSTNTDGTRNYAATPMPYEIMGFGNSLNDFSEIEFPAWPSFYTGMPRDVGYTALSSGEKSLEGSMLKMPVDCAKCHGDPDGAGPLAMPAQGDLIYAQPSRLACGSCHDDWVWDRPYTANQMTMPAQNGDAVCKDCHSPTDVRAYHTHPLADPTVATGINIHVTSVTDVGGNNDGHFDAGEKVQFVFDIRDDQDAPIAASTLTRLEYTLTGPTENPQFLTYGRLAPTAASLAGAGPYTVNMPDIVYLEPVGTSTGALESFATARAPHWNVTTGSTTQPTTLLRRTGLGASTTMAAAADVAQDYIDVVSATGIANGNYIVIDDANGTREYMRVQLVAGTRLWFGTVYTTASSYKPSLTIMHPAGTTVDVVTTSTVPTTSWSLDAQTGIVTETTEFGAGEILATYWTDFVVPSVYPGNIYNSGDLGEAYGAWNGLPILDGTYKFDLHGAGSISVNPTGLEATTYTQGAHSSTNYVLFGAASTVEEPARVEGAAACNKCHNDIQFHGGSRKGYDVCITCHGTAAVEDRPLYAGGGSQTPTATFEFRNVLHELHEGVFPAMPGGVAQCAACHGADNDAWKQPADRLHPNQVVPTKSWGVVCSSCHTSNAASGHIEAMTSPSGYETCALCHGEGKDKPVEFMHLSR